MRGDVFPTEAGQHRSLAKFHWPDGRGVGAACSRLPLALFGSDPATVPPGRRCRANGCRQGWHAAGIDPEEEPA